MPASIEFIEGIIATYQSATEANLRTPTRHGNVVILDEETADDCMVTADLHGDRKNFNQIKRIAALDDHPRRHLILQEVCHGGPTYQSNGGCMSHTLLEDVAKLKAAFPERVHFLLSNHELAELTDYPILKSKRMLNLPFRLGMQEVYGPATDKVREALLPFVRSCPLAVRLPGEIFICHSLPEATDTRGFDATIFERELDPSDFQEHGKIFRLVWGRDYRPENAAAFAELVGANVLIHGHEPCAEGFEVPNDRQLILDCQGRNASYVMLPVADKLSHEQIVERVQKLG